MLTRIKNKFRVYISGVTAAFHNLGLTPNDVSGIGFLFSIFSAFFYFWHPEIWFIALATILLLLSGFFDALDGAIASKYGEITKFGGFIDSTLDRVSDAIVFCGIILGGLTSSIWGLAAIVSSFLVSYTRARGEGVGVNMASVGIAERPERILLIAAAAFLQLIYSGALEIGIIIVTILSVLTVLQRTVYVAKHT
ncbi:MAG TPA: archaetidylinositol phosphate synthase [archaeon]|nr:archaetidylinositol phosphate synthase [archaeon]